jgi:hypothetical protein
MAGWVKQAGEVVGAVAWEESSRAVQMWRAGKGVFLFGEGGVCVCVYAETGLVGGLLYSSSSLNKAASSGGRNGQAHARYGNPAGDGCVKSEDSCEACMYGTWRSARAVSAYISLSLSLLQPLFTPIHVKYCVVP